MICTVHVTRRNLGLPSVSAQLALPRKRGLFGATPSTSLCAPGPFAKRTGLPPALIHAHQCRHFVHSTDRKATRCHPNFARRRASDRSALFEKSKPGEQQAGCASLPPPCICERVFLRYLFELLPSFPVRAKRLRVFARVAFAGRCLEHS